MSFNIVLMISLSNKSKCTINLFNISLNTNEDDISEEHSFESFTEQ